MTIGKVTSNQINPSPASTVASTATNNSKNIQNQITSKEQHLNRLSSDSKLSAEEKEKKRQEIQKEIDELNRKLELMRMRQEEAEKKAAAKQEKAAAVREEILSTENSEKSHLEQNETDKTISDKQPADIDQTSKAKPKQVDMPIEDVQKMLTADYALQKELAERHVDKEIESTVNVLEAEIKQDQLHGADTTAKAAEIEAIRTKENFWTESQTAEPEKPKPATGMNPDAHVIVDTI